MELFYSLKMSKGGGSATVLPAPHAQQPLIPLRAAKASAELQRS